MTVFSREADSRYVWRREAVPADRWVGIVLGVEGWRRIAPERVAGGRDLQQPDFDQEVALVASMGTMPSGGYAIRVRRVQYEAAGDGSPAAVRVEIEAASPGPGDFVTMALTHPSDVVVIPRRAWPEGVLARLAAGEVRLDVVDQDGRNWGPGHVL